VEISKEGGIAAVESVDRNYLYYSKYETTGIWRLPLQGGPEVRVLDKPDGINWFNWSLVRNGIYLLNTAEKAKATVDSFDFASPPGPPCLHPGQTVGMGPGGVSGRAFRTFRSERV